MDIDQVRTFLEVASSGTFVRAADRLNVTQSTVSARIRGLEDQLGRTLFVRNKSGATLTAAGIQFHKHAISLLRTWEQARQEVAIPEGYHSAVRVGGEAGLWNRLLYRWVPWMRAHHPDMALRCELGLPEDLMSSLLEGRLDIGVMYTPQSRPGMKIDLLCEDQLVLVSSEPPGRRGAEAEYVYVDWGREFRRRHRMSFPDFTSPGVFVGLGTLGFQYVLDNGGTGYFPRRLAEPYIEEGRLHVDPDAPTFLLPIYMVYPEEGERALIEPTVAGLRHVVGNAPQRRPAGATPLDATPLDTTPSRGADGGGDM